MKLLDAPEQKQMKHGSVTINKIPHKSCYRDSNDIGFVSEKYRSPDHDVMKRYLGASKRAPKRK